MKNRLKSQNGNVMALGLLLSSEGAEKKLNNHEQMYDVQGIRVLVSTGSDGTLTVRARMRSGGLPVLLGSLKPSWPKQLAVYPEGYTDSDPQLQPVNDAKIGVVMLVAAYRQRNKE